MSPAAAFWLGVRRGIWAEASARSPSPRRSKRRAPRKTRPVEFAPRAFTAAELAAREERMEANR